MGRITIAETVAAYTDGTFTLGVYATGRTDRDGKAQRGWTIFENGKLLAHGDDLYGHGDMRDALGSLVAFLHNDAGRYRRHMGPVPSHEDPYAFGEPVAEWAYGVSDELAMAYAEITETEEEGS